MINDLKLKIIIIFMIIGLVSCGGGGVPMGRDFSSISGCVSSMKGISSGPLKIVTDRSDRVAGALANGKTFNCEKKSSGTKGNYVEGWYMKAKSK
jgi:hypothetical protein